MDHPKDNIQEITDEDLIERQNFIEKNIKDDKETKFNHGNGINAPGLPDKGNEICDLTDDSNHGVKDNDDTRKVSEIQRIQDIDNEVCKSEDKTIKGESTEEPPLPDIEYFDDEDEHNDQQKADVVNKQFVKDRSLNPEIGKEYQTVQRHDLNQNAQQNQYIKPPGSNQLDRDCANNRDGVNRGACYDYWCMGADPRWYYPWDKDNSCTMLTLAGMWGLVCCFFPCSICIKWMRDVMCCVSDHQWDGTCVGETICGIPRFGNHVRHRKNSDSSLDSYGDTPASRMYDA
ncbi:unnamed protein product [Owenia fusiformis]|uniref:Uncharacterized protein n=1 Tax=Owenia fusiformis TaxID=6347 RepID=A0A8J1UYS5_OWEFU|nr:unnamed protein product [Owenia fusiformis]